MNGQPDSQTCKTRYWFRTDFFPRIISALSADILNYCHRQRYPRAHRGCSVFAEMFSQFQSDGGNLQDHLAAPHIRMCTLIHNSCWFDFLLLYFLFCLCSFMKLSSSFSHVALVSLSVCCPLLLAHYFYCRFTSQSAAVCDCLVLKRGNTPK